MTRAEAIEITKLWMDGHGFTLSSEEEMQEYYELCLTALREQEQSQWISVEERLPEEHEYTAESAQGGEYYVRLLIAYMTDTVEYTIGHYDGYKWFTEPPIRIIHDVIAWRPFMPLPEPPRGESDATL